MACWGVPTPQQCKITRLRVIEVGHGLPYGNLRPLGRSGCQKNGYEEGKKQALEKDFISVEKLRTMTMAEIVNLVRED